jgi:hypothetical protein
MDTLDSFLFKKITGLLLSCALMWGAAVSAEPAGRTDHLLETIHYLLEFVKRSECRFYRNNKMHTAGEAAAHMQKKYEHFKGEIKIPEDFIRLAATRSLMTGKRYHVELKNGKKITSEAWLLQALEAYRQKQD